ncbi:hypothetical protein CYMTET_15792 [Cymbomonas tetramitiformis]|uniref:Uncharacterized protein n=1 Tax=Cymbomonas tetramitiformis TaxID=36881 RepID=A0AAE0L8K3_9CHLO|nr:hypothetical protein CYMTET_15792 [Cymbomonas tetramitiformis]
MWGMGGLPGYLKGCGGLPGHLKWGVGGSARAPQVGGEVCQGTSSGGTSKWGGRLSQGTFKWGVGGLPGHLKWVWEVCQGISSGVWEVCQGTSSGVWEVCQGTSSGVWEGCEEGCEVWGVASLQCRGSVRGVGRCGEWRRRVQGVRDLEHNSISGSIPAELAQMDLRFVYLNDNSISGSLPIELNKLEDLLYMNVSNNHALCGPIPPQLAYRHVDYDGTNLGLNCTSLSPRSSREVNATVATS